MDFYSGRKLASQFEIRQLEKRSNILTREKNISSNQRVYTAMTYEWIHSRSEFSRFLVWIFISSETDHKLALFIVVYRFSLFFPLDIFNHDSKYVHLILFQIVRARIWSLWTTNLYYFSFLKHKQTSKLGSYNPPEPYNIWNWYVFYRRTSRKKNSI